MYNVGEFLQCAMTNILIFLIDDNGCHITTINKMDKKYDVRTFTCWEIKNGRLLLYLDRLEETK